MVLPSVDPGSLLCHGSCIKQGGGLCGFDTLCIRYDKATLGGLKRISFVRVCSRTELHLSSLTDVQTFRSIQLYRCVIRILIEAGDMLHSSTYGMHR